MQKKTFRYLFVWIEKLLLLFIVSLNENHLSYNFCLNICVVGCLFLLNLHFFLGYNKSLFFYRENIQCGSKCVKIKILKYLNQNKSEEYLLII